MISLENLQIKAVIKVIDNVAKENGVKFFLHETTTNVLDEATFNSIIWFPEDTKVFRQDMESLPAPISYEDLCTRIEQLQAKNIWTSGRKSEYPPVEEQLDMIFKDIDAWRDKIQAIKDKYPKV